MSAIFGIGNPLLDISAEVPQAVLDKYEVKLNNAILCEDKHKPIYGELVSDHKVQYIAGGATQNSIRVAQWMLREAGSTAFIGCVGKDSFGEQLRKCAEGDKVAVHYLEDAETPTGTCAVLIKDAERSLIANLSAANNYKIGHLDTENIQPVWQGAKIVYSAGFFLTVSPPSLMKIAEHARDTNRIFTMNLSAPFITQFFAEPLMAAIPFVDILFGNESEAQAFGEKQAYEDQTVKGVALKVAGVKKENGRRGRLVVFTQGADPTIVVQDGVATEYPVPKVENIVDVNGAGDAFVGGFLAAYSKGKAVPECVRIGHYCAGVILGVSGTVLATDPKESL